MRGERFELNRQMDHNIKSSVSPLQFTALWLLWQEIPQMKVAAKKSLRKCQAEVGRKSFGQIQMLQNDPQKYIKLSFTPSLQKYQTHQLTKHFKHYLFRHNNFSTQFSLQFFQHKQNRQQYEHNKSWLQETVKRVNDLPKLKIIISLDLAKFFSILDRNTQVKR